MSGVVAIGFYRSGAVGTAFRRADITFSWLLARRPIDIMEVHRIVPPQEVSYNFQRRAHFRARVLSCLPCRRLPGLYSLFSPGACRARWRPQRQPSDPKHETALVLWNAPSPHRKQ